MHTGGPSMPKKNSSYVWSLSLLFIGLIMASAAAHATPMLDLQRAVVEAQARADAIAKERDRLHQDTLKALSRHDTAAFTSAEKREAGAVIGDLQSTAALRRAHQALADAVNDAAEQGEALERAASRAAAGEVAPSVRDHLSCEGPDCTPISPSEHAALIMMGAVGPTFEPAKWPPEGEPPPITALAYTPNALLLAALRRAVEESTQRAQTANARAEAARTELQNQITDAATSASDADAYAKARIEADTAQTEKAVARARLQHAIDAFAADGRALKRAALLAGDGYALKAGGNKICNRSACTATEGLEAAAFFVIGAAEDMNDGQKRFGSFVTRTIDGQFVFR